jgi:acyl-CoA synthetase (AMP-forming)/AMP-acid ligase II
VLRPKFDPEETLRLTAEHRARVLAVVPVMMSRMLALPEEVKRRYDLSALEVTAASGSALPGELATRWMDEFGDNLYNLYGSTEVSCATIATPEDMRAAPGTAGRPPRGTVIRIVDEEGNDVEPGDTGRIFVGNQLAFEGYTGGGGKEHLGDLLSSGDVGHFDDDGRLFVDGRDDEMIVSGGENVFPREVEDLLSDHQGVHEAAAIGVDDEQFGQRLKAFVVKEQGASVSEEDLKGHVKANLARYKVPREIVFVEELPRNATGKVLKRELAEQQSAD